MVTFAFGTSVLVLLVLWILYRLVSGSWSLWKIVDGEDGRPSTSKFQWFLWTVVVIFAYVAVVAAKVRAGSLDVITAIPDNLLLAMGFTTVTMVAAKGITTAYKARGQIEKPSVAEVTASGHTPHGLGLAGIIEDDNGKPDLSKIQMITWTLLAVAIYLLTVWRQLGAGVVSQLPDIDSVLMALMGLGQGGYLGKKFADVGRPQ